MYLTDSLNSALAEFFDLLFSLLIALLIMSTARFVADVYTRLVLVAMRCWRSPLIYGPVCFAVVFFPSRVRAHYGARAEKIVRAQWAVRFLDACAAPLQRMHMVHTAIGTRPLRPPRLKAHRPLGSPRLRRTMSSMQIVRTQSHCPMRRGPGATDRFRRLRLLLCVWTCMRTVHVRAPVVSLVCDARICHSTER